MSSEVEQSVALYKLTYLPTKWHYVGISAEPGQRFQQHLTHGHTRNRRHNDLLAEGYFPEMTVLAWYPNRAAALEAEAEVMQAWQRKGVPVVNRYFPAATETERQQIAQSDLLRERHALGRLHPCHVCRRRLPVEEFHVCRSRSSGLASKCRACCRIIGRIKNQAQRHRHLTPAEAYAEARAEAERVNGLRQSR